MKDRIMSISDQERSQKRGKRGPYRLKRRAERQAETGREIARAAFELHRTVGPSRATVTAIAERAGVQRLTVYRHFPDDEAIFSACSAYAFEQDPPPDPANWSRIDDPENRLRAALRALYSYYRRNRQLYMNLYRDAGTMAVVAERMELRQQGLAKARGILAEGWPTRDAKAARMLMAAIGHSLDFGAWRSLTETQELADDDAIEMMVKLVQALAPN